MYQEVEATPVIELVRVLRPCLLDLSIGSNSRPAIWYPPDHLVPTMVPTPGGFLKVRGETS
jgi:hypothetical protein